MRNYDKKIVVTAAFLAAVTIAIGAFGAHGLKKMVNTEAILSFETGVRYQMYHVIALLVIGFTNIVPSKTKDLVFWFFIFGMLFFSGSIYLLSLKAVLSFDPSVIAFLTPIGGLLFIIGWIILGIKMISLKKG